MIIRLPWVQEINTLDLPDNFDELVRESFQKFTEGTAKEYRFEDKLLYLDNIRRSYARIDNAEASVNELIMGEVRYNLENGEMPDAEDILSLEFMEKCYDAGFRPFRTAYEGCYKDNEETLKVILKIIQIVVNYEE